MSDFNEAVGKTLAAEGGFFHNQVTGEIVNYGWTASTLASLGEPSTEDYVRSLTRDRAITLYREYFWNPLSLDSIADQALANKVFDIAVNQGLGTSARLLQEAVNDLQLGGAILQIDGKIGPKTIDAANALPASNLLTTFRSHAKQRYMDIAAKNPQLKGDLPGWLQRLAS
jgi:lysozyme family protein